VILFYDCYCFDLNLFVIVPICFAVVMLFIEILYRFGDNGGESMHCEASS
jgi:hypothetical protein